MKIKKKKIIAIVGPTTSGKSELAVTLAKKFGGEVISADSRQIYRGLNIGSGKVLGRWENGVFCYKHIPHHLIDEIHPRHIFNVAEFKRRGVRAINTIFLRGHIPIVAGGTGFYVNALVYDIAFPDVPPNIQLRARLTHKSTDQLFGLLKKVDPKRARTIDPHNPRRLIRALEIAAALGHSPKYPKMRKTYDTLVIGIDVPKKKLFWNIDRRLAKRLRAGMLKEIHDLMQKGLSYRRLEKLGLEYRFGARHLKGTLTRNQLIVQLQGAIHDYACRQMTWFHKNNEIRWVPFGVSGTKKAVRITAAFLKILPRKHG